MIDEITKKADELCEIDEELEELKKKKEELEGYFLRLAQPSLENKKVKTARFFGTGRNEITVTLSSSVKLLNPSVLRKLFGSANKDELSARTSYLLKSGAARAVSAAALGETEEMSKKEIISEFVSDRKTASALLSKVKGVSFKKDAEVLEHMTGFDRDTCEYIAYLIYESECLRQFKAYADCGRYEGDFEAALKDVKKAVAVDKVPKLTISRTRK